MAFFKDGWCTREEINRTADPPVHITYLMLTPTGIGFSTGFKQIMIVVLYWNQVTQAGLEAWAKLEKGPTESPIASTIQKPVKMFLAFIALLQMSLEKKLPLVGLETNLLCS